MPFTVNDSMPIISSNFALLKLIVIFLLSFEVTFAELLDVGIPIIALFVLHVSVKFSSVSAVPFDTSSQP